ASEARDHGPVRVSRLRLHVRRDLSRAGERREDGQDPAHRRRHRGQAQGSPHQQGGLLLAVRARTDDRGLSGERLVSGRRRVGSGRDRRVSYPGRAAGGTPDLQSRRARRQQGAAPAQRGLMRWNRSLIPTLRDDPADAEAVSHRLMVRAGLVRQLAAGIYVYLPLGLRVLDKVNAVIREEMNAIGGQEITMPVLLPAEIWQQSGRWDAIGSEMFRLKDRHGRDMCLGMTHEEVVAWLASKEIRSYRELPQVWYQIQTKERDEARPRSGVLRTREFWMKDAYTLDVDDAGLDVAYEKQKEAYKRIFKRSGVAFHVVESDVGMMGGAGAHEFMAPSEAGEDEIARCPACGYAANVELARSKPSAAASGDAHHGEVATPGVRTIAEVCQLLGIEPTQTIKSLLYVGPSGPVLALVRGDQQLHEKKLARLLGGEVRAAHPDEVRDALGAPVGSVGPVGVTVPIVADEALGEGTYVAGANREGVHLRGVRPGRDFTARHADLHLAQAGDACASCGTPLLVERVIEVGNIFKLGTRYSAKLGATYLDEQGQAHPIVMGSYGIGPARIVASAIE